MHSQTRISTTVVLVAAAVGGSVSSAQGALPLTPVALTDTDGALGPGLGAGVEFNILVTARISNAGDVVIHTTLDVGGSVTYSNNAGVWRAGVGTSPAIIAREGEDGALGPGLGTGVVFTGSLDDLVNPATNTVAVGGQLSGTGINSFNNSGGWLIASGGNPSIIVREGTDGALGPGLGTDVTFQSAGSRMSIGGGGDVAFPAAIWGGSTTSSNGVWRVVSGGSPAAIALNNTDGAKGPGLGTGVTFANVTTGVAPSINAAGTVTFRATLAGTGITSANDDGFWRSTGGGSPAAIALTGTDGAQGPGQGAGVNFGDLGNVAKINDTGTATFRGLMTGTGISTSNDSGIWKVAGAGSPAAVALEGTDGAQGPGLGGGVYYGNFGGDPQQINGSGDIAFWGTLTGSGVTTANDETISIVPNGGSPVVVAREGTDGPLGPGLGAGVTFRHSGLNGPVINAAGQMAFTSDITGTGIDSSNDKGIWYYAGGSPVLVVREGDVVDVDPGVGVDNRTVVGISMSVTGGGQDGYETPLNESGQLTFGLTFSGGSRGIFVATIPEPASASLLLVTLAGATLRRRRR